MHGSRTNMKYSLVILLMSSGIFVLSTALTVDKNEARCTPPLRNARPTGKCVSEGELDQCDGLTIAPSDCVPLSRSKKTGAFCCFATEPRLAQFKQLVQSALYPTAYGASTAMPGSGSSSGPMTAATNGPATNGPSSGASSGPSATTPGLPVPGGPNANPPVGTVPPNPAVTPSGPTVTTTLADDSGFPCPYPANPDCEGNNPTKPMPAPGVGGPPSYYPAFSDGDGGPVDFFSGMSVKGWNLARDTLNTILYQSAVATNMSNPNSTVQQYRGFAFARMYLQMCFFSPSRAYSTLDPKLGCEGVWVKSFLDRDKAAAVAIERQFVGQIFALADAASTRNWGPYFALVDDLAYTIHYQIEQGTFDGPGLPAGTKIKIGFGTFAENANAGIYMCRFILGSGCTYEMESSLTWAIYVVELLNWHYLNLYELGCKARNQIGDFTMFIPPNDPNLLGNNKAPAFGRRR